jgi:hypothetical protein
MGGHSNPTTTGAAAATSNVGAGTAIRTVWGRPADLTKLASGSGQSIRPDPADGCAVSALIYRPKLARTTPSAGPTRYLVCVSRR